MIVQRPVQQLRKDGKISSLPDKSDITVHTAAFFQFVENA
jgi:hypothetical protein